MNSKVETIAPIEHLDCMKSNKLQSSDKESVQNAEEPNEETTVKKAIEELYENQPIIKQELSDIPNDNIKQEISDLNSAQDVEMKDQVEQGPQSDTNKVDDQDADVEEEVAERDEERDKVSQDGILDDGTSSMGRNRRVRQKNRYFLDFHCIDLTKGGRSNKDEYEAFTNISSATTRSSNRRSTLDSNRASQDEPDGFETKYCRKCSSRTPHDLDSGCQACLYKKIVESSKRQRPSNQRNRSSASRQQQQQQQQQQQSQGATVTSNNNHIVESATITTVTSSSTATSRNNNHSGGSSSTNNKRKATKQSGPSNKIANNSINQPAENNIIIEGQKVSNSDSNSNNCCSANANNNLTNPNSDTSSGNSNNANNTQEADDLSQALMKQGATKGQDGEQIVDCKFPRLDAWSPDEVADYIQSKGFAEEAELFKSQSVDGISLLLMQRTDFTFGLKIKLGPALKIYDQVCKMKKEYFRNIIRGSQMSITPTNSA